ncbi:oligosaccharide flippase family protein [Falsirhodobacter algicola]|uniref:Oligosaccharide flippase family protein n=1 Tax=Falsirhodobacter algicola TaxID=2692330 RepID=A0A8J8SJS2_9RHOB|nr:oligosaccharide flippase family protein [Falsirhodobacter algicola]QUS35110.1 oligosaccharide flippase family protein [Falsirhodobacter algicola]
MLHIRRSLAFSVIDKVTGVVLSILTMAVVSRLLAPAEVGVFMIGSSIVILIEALRDFGVSACLVQARELTPHLVRTAMTVMAILSLVLGTVIWWAAIPLAQFYDSAELTGIVHVAVLAFLAAPVANPLLALLRREMAFGRVALIGMAAGLTNTALSVGLALAGFGAFALIWASVAAAFVTAAGAVLAHGGLPPLRPSLREWRQVVPFGAWSSIITLLGMLLDSLPRLILGRMLGLDAAGLFTRAVALNQLPERLFLNAVQPVVLPAMAARLRAGEAIAAPWLMGIALITALQWPVLMMIALLAAPIVGILLGGGWTEVTPILRIVALSSICLFPQYLAFPVLVAAGRVREMALASLFTVPVSGGILLVASVFGLQAVAAALILTGALQSTVALALTWRCVRFAWRDLGTTLGQSALVTLAAVLPAAGVMAVAGRGLAPGPGIAAIATVAAMVGWRCALRLMAHPLDAQLDRITARLRPASGADAI